MKPEVLQTALERAVSEAGAPGAVAYVGRGDTTLFHGAVGHRQVTPKRLPLQKDTPFDLASLTKVVATTTAAMLLFRQGKIILHLPVAEYIPVDGLERFTVQQLLHHTSGLPSHKVWYRELDSVNGYIQRIAKLPLAWEPGSRRQYSDLGFILLGKIVELVAEQRLDAFCSEHIFKPLGLARTTFNPPAEWRASCAATERCGWRGRVMVGQVHDENAYAMGGVAGHAGLFSTAGELAAFCRALLTPGKLLPEQTLEVMFHRGQVPHYPWQVMGWKTDPWMNSVEGYLPSRDAVGHTGWTGTSIWIDRDRDLFAILLGNTCHPSRRGRNHKKLRGIFHAAVKEQLYPRRTNVHLGVDYCAWKYYKPVRGRRAALLTHMAAVDTLKRTTLDVMKLNEDVMLRRIYTPEHGLKGQAEAGEKVSSGRHGSIPVTSLYGDRKRPSAAELKELELFIVDMQDVGSRYYTYMATMKDCIEACAEARVPVVVLDRPNPLGGEVLEGPIAKQTGSPVCCAPLPVRHGMTMGELAEFFNRSVLKTKADLTVLPVNNWFRNQWFWECQLPWQRPSPNIPKPETALLYVGMCLFEGTNVTEGRGTHSPFHYIGAPWIDGAALREALDDEAFPGLNVTQRNFIPISRPKMALHPRYESEICNGVHLEVTNPFPARPFTSALALIKAIRDLHPDRFEFKDFFDTLAGGSWLREEIEAGKSAAEITDASSTELGLFDIQRPKRYLSQAEWLEEWS